MIRYLVVLGILAGCAGSPLRIGMMDDEDLMRTDIEDLCFAYAEFNKWDSKIKVELLRRGIFNAKEWQAIDHHKIFIGMSEQAFQCSWPDPDSYGFDSGSVTKEGPWGVRTVYEYGNDPGGLKRGSGVIPGKLPKKVYVENGVIVAFHDATAAGQSDCLSFQPRKCFDFDGLVSTKESDALIR